jgi:hypothetical protein
MKTMPAIVVPIGVPQGYARAIRAVLRDINRDIKAAADAHYSSDPDKGDARGLILAMAAIRKKYEPRFEQIARSVDARVIDKIIRSVDMQVSNGIHRARAGIYGGGYARPNAPTVTAAPLAPETAVKAVAFSAANVALIGSVFSVYLFKTSQTLTTGVQQGRPKKEVMSDLSDNFKKEFKRAGRAANDGTFQFAQQVANGRMMQAGIKTGVWIHRHGDKKPRPSHLAAHGSIVTLREGLYDPDEGRHVQPGELYGCTCTIKGIVEK